MGCAGRLHKLTPKSFTYCVILEKILKLSEPTPLAPTLQSEAPTLSCLKDPGRDIYGTPSTCLPSSTAICDMDKLSELRALASSKYSPHPILKRI